jgi:hypothetical protein
MASRVADGEFLKGVGKDDRGFAEVSFRVKGDALGSLLRLLNHCRAVGAMGHSFSVVADPDNSEYRAEFGFDGDGADRVEGIEAGGEPLPEDFGGPTR